MNIGSGIFIPRNNNSSETRYCKYCGASYTGDYERNHKPYCSHHKKKATERSYLTKGMDRNSINIR